MPLTVPVVRLRGEARALVQALVRYERAVSALLVGLAVLAGLRALQPPAGPTVSVVVAARDLPAGSTLSAGDLAVLPMPADAAPAGAVADPVGLNGRVVALPVGRREALTETRLLGRGLLDRISAGAVGVPVRVADAGAAALLRAGDRVDVVLAADASGAARTVASDLAVVAVPAPGDGTRLDGALVVVAAPPGAAGELATASATGRLAVAVRARR